MREVFAFFPLDTVMTPPAVFKPVKVDVLLLVNVLPLDTVKASRRVVVLQMQLFHYKLKLVRLEEIRHHLLELP